MRPILHIIGVPGHLERVEALTKEFHRPVVGIVLIHKMDIFLTQERRRAFSKVFSFPNFFRCHIGELQRLDQAEIDRRQLELQDKHGIPNSAKLVYFDRDFQFGNDYREHRLRQLAQLMFLDLILDDIDPVFAMDGVVTYFQNICRCALHHRGIPFLTTQNFRASGYFAFYDIRGQQIGMSSLFRALRNGETAAMSDERRGSADRWLSEFLERPTRPGYAEQNSRTGFRPARVLRNVSSELRWEKWSRSAELNLVDIPFGYHRYPWTSLKNGLMRQLRASWQTRHDTFERNPDLDLPFAYLPLHFSPEISDMVFGADYDHHEAYVLQVAKNLPLNMRLYVKEHTSMLGRRSSSFYRNLNSRFNVRVVSPSVNTFDLIRHSKLVVAVTGTAGWEAYLMNKPVVALGDVFYNFLPGVLHTSLYDDFESKLEHYLANFKSDPNERRDAVRAWFGTAYGATKGDIGNDTETANAKDNAAKFAGSVRSFLQERAQEYEGMPPASSLTVTSAMTADT